MTDRLWEYLENEFNTTNKDYIEIEKNTNLYCII